MLRLLTGPDDLAATRFALSPAWELGQLVRLLLTSPATPLARRLASGWQTVRADPAVRTVGWLQGPAIGAAFSAPPPAGMGQTLEDDLRTLLAADPAVVRRELDEVRAVRRPDASVAAVLDDPALLPRLATAMRTAWTALLAPEWPRVRAVLERDVRFRAERLAEGGWSAAVGGIHAQLTWRAGAVELARGEDADEVLGGRGLLLVPSVFAQGVAVYRDEPWQPSIVYPARGAGLVFEAAEAATDPLAPLLGRTRAGLLLALAVPSSTTQLAHLTGASIGATGDHLRVLLDAGLVVRGRVARSVLYRRTPLGDALAAP